jgi:hypothetical protein
MEKCTLSKYKQTSYFFSATSDFIPLSIHLPMLTEESVNHYADKGFGAFFVVSAK